MNPYPHNHPRRGTYFYQESLLFPIFLKDHKIAHEYPLLWLQDQSSSPGLASFLIYSLGTQDSTDKLYHLNKLLLLYFATFLQMIS